MTLLLKAYGHAALLSQRLEHERWGTARTPKTRSSTWVASFQSGALAWHVAGHVTGM